MYKATVSIVLYFVIGFQICHGHPQVTLRQGVAQGFYKKSYDGRTISAFEGIPYAKPPVGDLRFREPIPATGWNDILIANKSYMCPQLDGTLSVVGTEDCLYLYVYVPKKHIDKDDNLDVLVHIHGGSLLHGSPYNMVLPDYIMDQDVILVTLNYRLGAAGFLSTGDSVVYGNNGYKDQTVALRWIKDNIKEFGGNPNSVTITGFSAGGASVEFHYLSPLSRGLFHRGHTQSAVVTNHGSLTLIPLQKAKQLSRSVGCTEESPKAMVECLRKTPIDQLVIRKNEVWFKPVVEKGHRNPFLPDIPYKMLIEKKVFDVPWIASNTINESLLALDSLYRNRKEIFDICRNWTEYGADKLDLKDAVDPEKLEGTLNELKKFYLDDCHLTEENGLEKLNKLLTDRYFLYGTDLAVRAQAAATKSPVYFYMFSFVPEDRLEFFGPPAASHGVDTRLMFKFRANPDRLKPQGEKMMRLFTKFLADYAKTGIPQIGSTKWTPIDPNQTLLNVLEIHSPDDIKMASWKEIAPRKLWESLPLKENKNLL